jgi:hypothetical protein
MSINNFIERLIKDEKLDDFNRLLRRRQWDEVPLFSRFSRINFLHGMSAVKKSEILVKFAVLHLNKILDYAELQMWRDLVILISINDFDNLKFEGDEPVCPNFWISSNIEGELKDFCLFEGMSEDSLLVRQWLETANLSSNHVVLNQKNMDSNDEFRRVYVARKKSRNLDIIIRDSA